nr:fibronectin type III domain-containing protein [Lachnospiraceae bacterium]
SDFDNVSSVKDLKDAMDAITEIIDETKSNIQGLIDLAEADSLQDAKDSAKEQIKNILERTLEAFEEEFNGLGITVNEDDSEELKEAKEDALSILDDLRETFDTEDGVVYTDSAEVIDELESIDAVIDCFYSTANRADNTVCIALSSVDDAIERITSIIEKEELQAEIDAASKASVERDEELDAKHEADMAAAASEAAAAKAKYEADKAEAEEKAAAAKAQYEADKAEAASKAAAAKAEYEADKVAAIARAAAEKAELEQKLAETNAKYEADMAEAASKAAAANAQYEADKAEAASKAAAEKAEVIEKAEEDVAALTQQLQSENGNLKQLVDASKAEIDKIKTATGLSADTADVSTIMNACAADQATATTIYEYVTKNGISMDTLTTTRSAVEAFKADGDVKGSSFGKLKAKTANKAKKKSITVTWSEVDADGYEIYGATAGTTNSNTLKAEAAAGTTKAVIKGLKKGKQYRFVVLAYKTVGNNKITVAVSKTVYDKTKGGKKARIKKVVVKKVGTVKKATETTLAANSSVKINSKMVKDKKKRALQLKRLISYESSNEAVATVAEDGTITGVAAGTCTIYVYAQSGLYKQVNVTVQ